MRGAGRTSCRTSLRLTGRVCCSPAAQGWHDNDDADALRDEPAFWLAVSSASGRAAFDGRHGLASQPTLSCFTAIMAESANRSVLRKAACELGTRAALAERRGQRPTLDVDNLPVDVHEQQPKAEWTRCQQADEKWPGPLALVEVTDAS